MLWIQLSLSRKFGLSESLSPNEKWLHF